MPDVRLITLDPGHFHAALIQEEMYPGVAARVDVYAPQGWDLDEHLKRVAGYTSASRSPRFSSARSSTTRRCLARSSTAPKRIPAFTWRAFIT